MTILSGYRLLLLKQMSPATSLTTVYAANAGTKWDVQELKDKIVLKTSRLVATVMSNTGAVSFTDINGKPVLQEKPINGRYFEPAIFDGEQLYQIKQTFETTPGDAIYGLGQHQDDVMNYRNQQVTLFQNNTEVAVPFLVSNKNYGILWENYS